MPRRTAEVTSDDTAVAPPTRDPFDFPMATVDFTFKGVTYKFRELTVAENDECRELSTDKDGKYDGRNHMRLMICNGAVDPIIKPEQLNKLPQRLYSKFVDLVSDLNNEDTLKEDGEEDDPGKA